MQDRLSRDLFDFAPPPTTRDVARLVKAAVGMTPKEYARVRRLQGLLRTLDSERSAIACSCLGVSA